MINVYPVAAEEGQEYQVQINGESVPLQQARVSAMPFNRRWPGHQREIAQTEIVNFLSLAADEVLHFTVTPPEAAESVQIRPRSLGAQAAINQAGQIEFTVKAPAYFTVEPYGRKRALHIFVDPIQEYDVDITDENVLYFGAGVHNAGEIRLTDGQTLFIDEGAVVYGNVRAKDARNIRILGRGILDNSRNTEEILFEANAENNDAAVNNALRTHTVWLEYCDHAEIDGITIRDSLIYNIRPVGCRNIHISNVKIIGNWRYNSDGIDMHNCEDVLIENCFIRTFDDCICVKGFDFFDQEDPIAALREATYHNGEVYDTFRKVRVKGCTLWNDWGKCLEIGAETKAKSISDIVFEDCDVIHATGPVLDCYNIDYADVHQVTYRDIRVEYDEEYELPKLQRYDGEEYFSDKPDYVPKIINIAVDYHPEYSKGVSERGRNHGFYFENIRLYGKFAPRMAFKGYDEEHKSYDILIRDLYLNDRPITEFDERYVAFKGYTENVRLVSYAQNEKNTVEAKGQLASTKEVQFDGAQLGGKRILFLGNSITLHGIRPEIGWFEERGMASSEKERDYVHRVMAQVRRVTPDAAFCICQAAEWERQYQNGEQTHELFHKARDFGADIIVMRLAENCAAKTFEPTAFEEELDKLLQYLDKKGGAKIIFTTAFWKHPADDVIIQMAARTGESAVYLGDLGEDPEMRADGLYEHKGVAHHPGDKGMEQIAQRIFERIRPFISKYPPSRQSLREEEGLLLTAEQIFIMERQRGDFMKQKNELPALLSRTEMLEILQKEEYGYLPPPPTALSFRAEEKKNRSFCAGKATLDRVEAVCQMGEKEFSFPFYVTMPTAEGKYPFFIHINFRPDVPDKYMPTEELVDNGFAVLSFCYNDVTRDNDDFTDGLAGVLYPDGKRPPDGAGKIALWSWAAQRVMDYAQTIEKLDCTRSVVCGHSRLGKTALLTGAFDERFAFTYSNDSGCSGAALSRGKAGETVAKICDRFPYWFCENYYKYADREDEMPFDQHYLLASIAPGYVCVGSATEDAWADPPSERRCCQAAAAAFKGGFPDEGRDIEFAGDIGYHLRKGDHYFSREDWNRLIQFIKEKNKCNKI